MWIFGSDPNVHRVVKNAWYTMELDRSIPRLSHTSTRVGSYLFVMGGHDGKQYSSDVLLLNLGKSTIASIVCVRIYLSSAVKI